MPKVKDIRPFVEETIQSTLKDIQPGVQLAYGYCIGAWYSVKGIFFHYEYPFQNKKDMETTVVRSIRNHFSGVKFDVPVVMAIIVMRTANAGCVHLYGDFAMTEAKLTDKFAPLIPEIDKYLEESSPKLADYPDKAYDMLTTLESVFASKYFFDFDTDISHHIRELLTKNGFTVRPSLDETVVKFYDTHMNLDHVSAKIKRDK